jgi:16S rRNA (guanine1207-N2)-methyltransferase
LDLGCGYGYLTLMLRGFPFARRVATDNCAAALLAMCANTKHYAMNVDVVASDAGNTVQETFDLLVCNPPFHRGAAVADDLTEHFLRQAARLLNRLGVAVFVVNAFIPVEQKAAAFFSSCELLVNNRSYKVLALRK